MAALLCRDRAQRAPRQPPTGAGARAVSERPRRRPPAHRQDRLGAARRRGDAATSAAPGSTRWSTTSPRCRARGQEVLIVSSGAIAVGRRHLGLAGRALRLEEKQAAAADRPDPPRPCLSRSAGPPRHRRRADPADARRHRGAPPPSQRARDARAAARAGAVPVINENDTVATAEIRFGDNDRLAARVAQMISADTLVLLSDIDGLYTADPRRDPSARAHPRGARAHAGDRGDGRQRAARLQLGRHGDQARRGAHRHGRRLPHGDRAGRRRCIRWPRSRTARARPGSCRRPSRAPRASAGSPARVNPIGRAHRRRRRRGGAARAARACCRPASSRSRATFERGDAVVVREPRRPRARRAASAAYSSADARAHRRAQKR